MQLQNEMLQCLAEENVEKLGELDQRCRKLFDGLDSSAMTAEEAEFLVESMNNFLDFHLELQKACVEQRDHFAADLRTLRSARKGARSYRDMEDRGS